MTAMTDKRTSATFSICSKGDQRCARQASVRLCVGAQREGRTKLIPLCSRASAGND